MSWPTRRSGLEHKLPSDRAIAVLGATWPTRGHGGLIVVHDANRPRAGVWCQAVASSPTVPSECNSTLTIGCRHRQRGQAAPSSSTRPRNCVVACKVTAMIVTKWSRRALYEATATESWPTSPSGGHRGTIVRDSMRTGRGVVTVREAAPRSKLLLPRRRGHVGRAEDRAGAPVSRRTRPGGRELTRPSLCVAAREDEASS